jgi:23S rRNA (cytosine1962-C5)-methyltransferase
MAKPHNSKTGASRKRRANRSVELPPRAGAAASRIPRRRLAVRLPAQRIPHPSPRRIRAPSVPHAPAAPRPAPSSAAAPPTVAQRPSLGLRIRRCFSHSSKSRRNADARRRQARNLLGTALYSPSSQIALRLVSREALDHAAWLELLASRLRAAIARRKPLLDAANDACRLCFSEADELPGLIADKYGDLVILQFLAKGLLAAGVRDTCVRVLREELSPAAILERPDPRIRELEGLPAPSLDPLWLADPAAPVATRVPSQRPRLSLRRQRRPEDRRVSRPAHQLRRRARLGRCAPRDPSLAAARSTSAATRADSPCISPRSAARSRASMSRAPRSKWRSATSRPIARQCQISAEVDWIEADAFEILRDWSQAGEKFDAIVLDPPAFAKTKRAVEGALRGYKELNLRALKMLRPGGLLVTCSCSHHVAWADLEGAVAAAAADASRRVRLLERRGAAPDHPVVLNLPETEYLKCLVLEVEGVRPSSI